jgi:hypothetical protein
VQIESYERFALSSNFSIPTLNLSGFKLGRVQEWARLECKGYSLTIHDLMNAGHEKKAP